MNKLVNFLHLTLMITLLVTCAFNLVNSTFSNMKSIVFINTTTNNNINTNILLLEVKHVVLNNYSWVSPTIQRVWGSEFFLFSQKIGGEFSPNTEEVDKIVEGDNLWYVTLLIFVFVNPRTLQSKVHARVTSFNKYADFWERILRKTEISEI